MAAIQENLLNTMARDIASLSTVSVSALSALYGMTKREITDIIGSDMFKTLVGNIREDWAINPPHTDGSLEERLQKVGELASKNRLLIEVDNEVDGTPATRITAARTILEQKEKKDDALFIALQMSGEKLQAILASGSALKRISDNISGPEALA
jgi:hypothetical protein